MRERRGKCTNVNDDVGVKISANPVKGGDDGDWVLGEPEDLPGEPCGLVSGFVGGHGGEEWETGGMEVGRVYWVL